MFNKVKSFIPLAMIALPTLVFAQATTLGSAITVVRGLLNTVVPILMTLAILYFFYGLIKYIKAAGGEEGKAQGRGIMINGVIALFVMASVWGLVAVLQNSFSIGTVNAPDPNRLIPQ